MAVKHETELYSPVKAFFTNRGYDVKAEIRNCDLVAYHPGLPNHPTIVEMKKTFTLPLLLQGADRQKTGAAVWLAVERNRTKKGAHNQRFNDIAALCKRLQLGLLTVTFYRTKEPVIDVWCEPPAFAAAPLRQPDSVAAEAAQPYSAAAPVRLKKSAARLQKEFEARSGDYNVGGSTKRKLVTAYRERAIQCALALECHGPSAPRQVREWTGCPSAAQVLRANYYGWFRRPGKGIYELSPAGRSALAEYAEVAAVWAAKFSWAANRDDSKISATGGNLP